MQIVSKLNHLGVNQPLLLFSYLRLEHKLKLIIISNIKKMHGYCSAYFNTNWENNFHTSLQYFNNSRFDPPQRQTFFLFVSFWAFFFSPSVYFFFWLPFFRCLNKDSCLCLCHGMWPFGLGQDFIWKQWRHAEWRTHSCVTCNTCRWRAW